MQHLWGDSPSPVSKGGPVTIFHRVAQPVAPPLPARLKTCIAPKGRPSGRSTVSSVSYIFPGSSRTGSDVSSNQSYKVSSHSYDSLDHQKKPVLDSSHPKRQVRIVIPEDEQDQDQDMQASYADTVGPCIGMTPFDVVTKDDDRYELVNEGSANADDSRRVVSGPVSRAPYRIIPRDTIQ